MSIKITIDKEKCIGCGACEASFPELFSLKENKAIVKKQPKTKAEEDKAREAVDICPVQAISV